MRIFVAGAGGMIGGHLVKTLLNDGHQVVAVDIKHRHEWWQVHDEAINASGIDLRDKRLAFDAMEGCTQVYDLAENMGGIGYIESNRIDCAESIEIGISLLQAATLKGVERFFFASSACVYNTDLQDRTDGHYTPLLSEANAWPAQPEEGYGFSKLYMEELCRHYQNETGIEVRIARYHNVYGSHGSWRDGKEKAPAALCRKVALAKDAGRRSIEIWGDGQQLRSYLDVHDCVRGTVSLMNSGCSAPVNIGSDHSVSVEQLACIIEDIAGVDNTHYFVRGAQGVDARNADISMAAAVIGWEPYIPLEEGLTDLYAWIEKQVIGASDVGT